MKLERKHLLILLLILVVGGFIAIRYYEKQKASQDNNGQANNLGPTGSNLNSIAPELVGGSTGPSIGPALSVPIDITVSSSATPAAANPIGDMMPVQPVGDNRMVGRAPTSDQWRMNPIYRANPDNDATGAQSNSPIQNAG